jgi:hypothetical protein
MHGVEHPYTRDLYERDDEGRVEVTKKDGRVGFYGADGHWLEGEIFDVDPQLCLWVCAPRGVHRMVNTASH